MATTAIKYTAKKGNEIVLAMPKTIDDFSNFFRPTKEAKTFVLSKSVDDVLRLISASLNAHSINIILDIEPNVSIHGYPNEFHQVLINLINNAKDALDEKDLSEKYIHINVYEKSGYAQKTETSGHLKRSLFGHFLRKNAILY
jgi:C4-dicarboxylate-specific signal transduction histidine kinase